MILEMSKFKIDVFEKRLILHLMTKLKAQRNINDDNHTDNLMCVPKRKKRLIKSNILANSSFTPASSLRF